MEDEVAKEAEGTIGAMNKSIMSNMKVVMVCAALVTVLSDSSSL